MNDWLVRAAFIIVGLLAYWVLPDPWSEITGWAALITFLWMVVVAARSK